MLAGLLKNQYGSPGVAKQNVKKPEAAAITYAVRNKAAGNPPKQANPSSPLFMALMGPKPK